MMDPHGDSIRRLATPQWAMDILLQGNPQAVSQAGLVGTDADSSMTGEQIAKLEALGFKQPGRPMTVTQMAQAIMAGALDPGTRIVRSI